MRQFTKTEAIAIAMYGKWKRWSDMQILQLQLYQRKLCVPFKVYESAARKLLNASVYDAEEARRKFEARFCHPTDADIDALLYGTKRARKILW
jgi:hypothetical protein